MLIVVNQADYEAVVSNFRLDHVRLALTRLLNASMDGLHVIVFCPQLCLAIENDAGFADRERAAAKKIRQKHTELGRLNEKVTVFGRLNDVPSEVGPVRSGNVWTIPLRWLAVRSLDEVQFVAEDLNDINVLVSAAHDSLNKRRFFKFAIRLEPVAGGGANTSRSFQMKAIERQKITICLVDSDKASPSAPIGNTASKCAQVSGSGLYELRVTDGRTIENVLPWRLIDAVRANHAPRPSLALSRIEAAAPQSTRYANLKYGESWYSVSRITRPECSQFWASVRLAVGLPALPPCCGAICPAVAQQNCHEVVVPGFGGSLLKDAQTWLELNCGDSMRHRCYAESADAREWDSVGQWVADYCLGTRRNRI